MVDPMCLTASGRVDEDQKLGLRRALNEIIIANQAGLIAGEEKPDARNLGATITEERRLGYVEMTMPIAERERLGIDTPT